MNKRLSKLADRIDAMTLRERGFVMAAVLAVMIMSWYSILVEPLNLEQDTLEKSLESLKVELKAISIQEEAVVKHGVYDPNEAERKIAQQLEKQLQVLDAEIKQHATNIVTPSQMTEVLGKILAEQANLQLISLSSVDAQPLLADPKKKQTKRLQRPEPRPQQNLITLYKHGMNIEIAGAYLDVLTFLQAVEKLEWDIFWDAISIKIAGYPNNRVSIKLHTVSLDSAWIGI